MKKIFLILFFFNVITFSGKIKEYENVYKLELSENYEENEINEIYYYGNKYHSALSLRANLKEIIGLNYNIDDKNTLDKKNLDFQFENPSKKLKIDFEKNEKNKLIAKIYSVSNYSETINFKYSNSTENLNNDVIMGIGYTNYNMFGRDRILELNYEFNSKNIVDYSKLNISYLFVNYEKLYKTKYELEFSYKKDNDYDYINTGIRTHFRGNILKDYDNLVFNFYTKYDFIKIEKGNDIYFSNSITIPFSLDIKYNYLNKINFKYVIQPEININMYPELEFNFNILNDLMIGYNYNKFSFNTEFILYNLIKKSEIDIINKYNKVDSKSYLTIKNSLKYNFIDNFSTELYNNIYIYKKNNMNTELGIVLDYENKKNFYLNTKLGFLISKKPKFNFSVDLKVKIK